MGLYMCYMWYETYDCNNGTRKVPQYIVNRKKRKKRAGLKRNHFCSLSGQRKTGYVGALVMLLTSAKEFALQDKIADTICL